MTRIDVMVKFYNRVNSTDVTFDEIPLDVIEFLTKLSCKELSKPFVIEELKAGRHIRAIARKYPVSKQTIETLAKVS